ncbi:MAG: glycine--tRNA ligase subunit beta [Alphaproteobacteria bacterium]|nr:glycine--tRNA ligase subunit beta [Alphaproteobacteria bacterium]
MADFLIELFSEEIPARMQFQALQDFKKLWEDKLQKENISFDKVIPYITPRRLVAHIIGLPLRQEDRIEELKGPRVGAPQQALDGFLKSAGLKIEDCIQKETDKGLFYMAQKMHQGRDLATILADLTNDIIRAFPWPKSMRWRDYTFRWVRPLHHILAIFNNKVIDGRFDLGGTFLKFTDHTQGHRFLASDPFQLTDSTHYKSELEKRFVLLDTDERRTQIKNQLENCAHTKNVVLKEDPALLQEMAGACEWPQIFMGGIDPSFLDVPYEVLETAMRNHQKYFSFRTKEGEFAPYFACVTNNMPKDNGQKIIQGNEQILKSRLFDAKFFWTQDRAQTLLSRVEKLESIVFHEKLGSLKEKIERLQLLSKEIAAFIKADPTKAARAALLCKTDLVTGMVGEFPELQGIMGRYYALHDGESQEVADAIASHYGPLGPSDTCPKELVSISLAIADKMDALVGFFANDMKPTGSKDPYALRRAALGIIRLILENNLRIPLFKLIEISYKSYGSKVSTTDFNVLKSEIMEFFVDRLKVFLREKGIRHDYINAIFSQGQEDDLSRLCLRVEALSDFLQTQEGTYLLTSYRRAGNILRIEEKKDGKIYTNNVIVGLLKEEEEKSLFSMLNNVSANATKKIQLEEYDQAMKYLVMLRQPVDLFFERITVNSDQKELRENRLGLLTHIVSTLHEIANFQKIEG